MARYGIMLSSFDQPLHALRASIEELQDLGYGDLWSNENYVLDAFTPLAVASTWAPSARLGLGIAQAYTRGAAILAMSIAGLCQAAPGRVVVGIGASTKIIVEDWNGVPYKKPYSRVRDTIRFLRAALAGGKVTEEYETFGVKGFRLAAKIEQPPPILIGAVRPRMLALAGQLGDGTILNNLSADDLKKVIPHVRQGNTDKEIVCNVYVALNQDVDMVRKTWRRALNEYLNAPAYAAAQKWMGHADELQETWEKWKAGDRKGAAAAIPDAFLDSLVVHGSTNECRDKIQRYVDNGADTVVIDMVPGTVDTMRAARALAPTGARH